MKGNNYYINKILIWDRCYTDYNNKQFFLSVVVIAAAAVVIVVVVK